VVVAGTLDFALLTRLRDVIGNTPATEAELRGLLEEGDAWARTLQAQIDAAERRLDELTAEEDGQLAEIASELRRVEELRPQLLEMQSLLADLDARARQLRTERLARRSGSPGSPGPLR
jgi:chromosome segregation ATPase